MGQAFIVRRGDSNGRFATGVLRQTSSGSVAEVTGVGFYPKQIIVVKGSGGVFGNTLVNLVWAESTGVVYQWLELDAYDYINFDITPNSDGFTLYETDADLSALDGEFLWVAFEKEQEV